MCRYKFNHLLLPSLHSSSSHRSIKKIRTWEGQENLIRVIEGENCLLKQMVLSKGDFYGNKWNIEEVMKKIYFLELLQHRKSPINTAVLSSNIEYLYSFHLISHSANLVIESSWPSVCMSVASQNTGCQGDLWLKKVFLILACNETINQTELNLFLRFDPPPKKKERKNTPTCHADFWSNNVFLIIACLDTIFQKRTVIFFLHNY